MRRSALLLVLLSLPGCSGLQPPAGPKALPNEVHWARNSAEYRALYLQTYRLAGERLAELVRGREAGTWAVSIDADETVIDNSDYQKELVAAGTRSTSERWAAWVARQEAKPLPGAVRFLAGVGELGGRIAVVTNRSAADCPATEANFRRHQIPFDVMLCREGESRDKNPRWQRIAAGTASRELPPLEIVMWLGDNIGDFPGLDQELRFATDEEHEPFGRAYFVFPNPMYGSWAGNPAD